MKIVCVQGDEFYIKPDTTLRRCEDRFFVPNFATDRGVAASEGVAVKITRMVKCIEPKFAYRTWSEFSHCADYQLIGYPQITIARSFDLSFATTDKWHEKEEMEQQKRDEFDATIAKISEFFTLRVGDYVFIANR